MTIVTQMMLIFLIVCAIAVCLTRNLLTSVIIYMGSSMIMSNIWITRVKSLEMRMALMRTTGRYGRIIL